MYDVIWKGIIEDLFPDFLDYFYNDWEELQNIDIERGFEFLDQELHSIYPERNGKRIVDKLVKVYMKDGKEKWFLIHIEVQGYKDDTLAERMFQCYYRIKDKYKKEIMALVILIDDDENFHPTSYFSKLHKTKVEYHFETFKLLNKTEEALYKEDNIFSYVMLAAKYAMKKTKDDRWIMRWKIDLIRSLLSKGYGKEKVRKVLLFIDYVANFNDKEVVKEYEEQKMQLIKVIKNMGIVEAILEQSFQKGVEKGLEEGIEKGIERGRKEGIKKGRMLVAENCLKKGLSPEETATITGLSLETIHKLAEKLKKR